MLTSGAIKEAISNGQVSISYSCLPDKKGIFRFLNSEASLNDPDAQKFFDKCIGENRVKLTIGPLVKSIYKSHLNTASQYYSFNVHDLRKASYKMDPLETIIVYTNEWIHLKDKHAGIIIQRVAHYFRGLNIAPSYVASGWQGILLAQITNNSILPLEISMGDDIARLFVFETKGESENIPNSSIHFGNKWHDYIDQRRNPFEEFGSKNSDASSDDIMSGLISTSIENSVDLQKKIATLTVSHQSDLILNLLKSSGEVENLIKEGFSRERKDIFSRLTSYLPVKSIYKFPLIVSLSLAMIYLLISASSFYISLFSSDPISSAKNLLDFATLGARLKESEKQVSELQATSPIHGKYFIPIESKSISIGKDQELGIERGKRSKFIVLQKSSSCGEIENRSIFTDKKVTLRFASKSSPTDKGECTFDWVFAEEKN